YYIPSSQSGDIYDASYSPDGVVSIDINYGFPTALKWGYRGDAGWVDSGIAVPYDKWQRFKIVAHSDDTYDLYSNGDTIVEGVGSFSITTVRHLRYSGKTIYIDSERVRKYTSAEPTYVIGSEHTASVGVISVTSYTDTQTIIAAGSIDAIDVSIYTDTQSITAQGALEKSLLYLESLEIGGAGSADANILEFAAVSIAGAGNVAVTRIITYVDTAQVISGGVVENVAVAVYADTQILTAGGAFVTFIGILETISFGGAGAIEVVGDGTYLLTESVSIGGGASVVAVAGYIETASITGAGAFDTFIGPLETVDISGAGTMLADDLDGTTVSFGAVGAISEETPGATGGSIVDSGGYRIHTFATDGTFTPDGSMDVEVLIVAGGGGAGTCNSAASSNSSSGGGAGGVIEDAAVPVTAVGFSVVVGDGGAGATSHTVRGSNGDNSSFAGLTSIGGGGAGATLLGGGYDNDGADGGSGGGGCANDVGGDADYLSPTQGFDGGDSTSNGASSGGTGGGGAGAVGESNSTINAGNGGAGLASSISGSEVYYSGGGGGGATSGTAGTGGISGNGDGGKNAVGDNGDANTGAGGGGAGGSTNSGGSGGSGIVIIRYPIPQGAGLVAVADYVDTKSITAQGSLEKLLLYLESLTIAGAGNVAAVPLTTYAVVATTAAAGSVDTGISYIFVDLDDIAATGWSVAKTIQDPLWKLTAQIAGTDVPTPFRHLRAIAPDHNGTLRTVFVGFLPQARTNLSGSGNFASLSGFDYAWYLTSQYIAEAQRITDEDTDPSVIISTILGDGDWPKTTGIEPYNMKTVTDWAAIKKSYIFDPNASKWKCIQEICEHTNHVFVVKWVDTGTDFHPVAYFVHEDDIDAELDVPALVTITAPDSEFVSASKESQQVDKINRVVVKGANKITGVWYDSVVESAEVAAGEEIPIEYRFESTDLDTQAKADARATTLYNFYNTDSDTYTINFKKRMDLELYQRIQFSGYDDIATGVMRVISIRYGRKAADSDVEVIVAPDQNLSNLRALSRLLGDDFMNTQDRIKEQFFIDLTKIAVGTVQSVNGDEVVVALERDGGLVKGRALS
ncbi:MAG: hypothetical protein KAJ03_09840, partial [Gammaproteobacteria bacterium]|nr:hypothetical protein [Gammaproteobacteria bacterium]